MNHLRPGELEEAEGAGCSFCGKQRAEVGDLLQGPSAHICDLCVRSLLKDPQGLGQPTEFLGFRAEEPKDTLLCCFCRGILKKLEPGARRPEAEICLDCLGVCEQILKENEEFDRREARSTCGPPGMEERGAG